MPITDIETLSWTYHGEARILPSNYDRGQTPLAGAAFKGDAEIAWLLLDHGAAPDGAGPDGKTPLMFAAMFDRPELIDLLLSRGADAARSDASGNTAFSLACAMGADGALAALERYRRT